MTVYRQLLFWQQEKRKAIALLIDPDKHDECSLNQIVSIGQDAGIDLYLVGGSLITTTRLHDTITLVQKYAKVPVILFPGNAAHVVAGADAVLFMSLISGRNAELLIGQQVVAAPLLRHIGTEVISTGYVLIDGGKPTTVSYISNTMPIPADKPDIVVATALAGEMLGLKCIYLEAGSGAAHPVPQEVIRAVRENIHVPLIVGGGLRSPTQTLEACQAGADMVVIGHAIEQDPSLIIEMTHAVHSCSSAAVMHQ